MTALDAVITVATPEGVVLSAPLADPLQRGRALLIDLFLMLFSFSAVTAFIDDLIRDSRAALGLTLALLFVFLWGYFFICEWRFNGQTIGKSAVGIRVVSSDLTPLSGQAALWRNVLRYIDFLPGCFGVGLFFILFSRQHQRLGDWMAGTVVIAEEPVPNPTKPITAAPEPAPWRLTHDEQATLLAFARYAENRSPTRSEEMAAIFQPLLPHLTPAERVQKLCAMAAGFEKRSAKK